MIKFAYPIFLALLAAALEGSAATIDSTRGDDEGKPVVIELMGDFQEIFMYYATLEVGSPPVKFTTTVDTGSSDFLVPELGCTGCYGGNSSQYYNAKGSTTSELIKCNTPPYKCTRCRKTADQCGYTMSYVGVSLDAWVFRDRVTVGAADDTVAVRATFGATYNVSFGGQSDFQSIPLFVQKKQALVSRARSLGMDYPEGMFGMCWKEIDSLGASPLFDEVVAQKKLKNEFALCLKPQGGGKMVLGSFGDWISDPSKIIWTPIVKKLFYNVYWLDVRIGGQSIGVPPAVYNELNAIVDSGTVMPTLPQPAWEKFKALLLKDCDKTQLRGICDVPSNETLLDGVCYKLTPSERSAFPVIDFVLRGDGSGHDAIVPYRASSYLQKQYFCQSPDEVAMGIDKDPRFAIIGAEMMQAYTTIFDRTNMRVGFSPQTC